MRREEIISKVRQLPSAPGVYEFLDRKGEVIYIGKAKDLRKRVSSYFRRGKGLEKRLLLMLDRVHDLNWRVTANEAEALIVEAALIKTHAPVFNIELKDDKSYPYLKLTVNEKFPRLYITRLRRNDGAIYYGPYVNVKLLREALSFMKKVFPLRSCRQMRKKRCLEFHIGQCIGPCEDAQVAEAYENTVEELKNFLEGGRDDLIRSLRERMGRYSDAREYEKAKALKERIKALSDMQRFHDRAHTPILGELDELKAVLDLPRLPRVIECFDISNTGGKQAVGAMVRFTSGVPDKARYRRFAVKSVTSPDDYAMMREVVARRYARLVEENGVLPDLVLIDGGRGHLEAASEQIRSVGAEIPVISIAKEHEHVYLESRKLPVRLPPGTRALLLLQRVRDEAHRFAIAYHRKLRAQNQLNTSLRNIKGIGPRREKMLLKKFGSLGSVKKASAQDLVSSGLDRSLAERIARYYGSV